VNLASGTQFRIVPGKSGAFHGEAIGSHVYTKQKPAVINVVRTVGETVNE
jgi:hypothetical protein